MKRAAILASMLIAIVAHLEAIPARIEAVQAQAAGLPVSPRASGQSLENSEFAARIQVLDASIKAIVAAEELPGLSIGLVHDQDLIWAKSYGFANLEKKIPASPATMYRIASVTKVFTATAIMQLRDAGKLDLDDPVVKHLPWFALKSPFAESPAITVWHVLTHTAGLPGESAGVSWNELRWPTREEMVRLLPEQELVLPPGIEYRYSNLGYQLLGEVIAAVSGGPYAAYIERDILKPLGMKATLLFQESSTPGLAVGYARPRRGMPHAVAPFLHRSAQMPVVASGGVATSVEDLARFASLHLRDSLAAEAQIVKSSTLRDMQRVHWLRPGWQSGAGLGWESIERVGEQIRVGHQGGFVGWNAELVIAPADKLAVIVLVNSSESFNMRRILNLAFETAAIAATGAAEPSRTVPAPDPTWEKYVGAYYLFDDEVRIMVLNGLLTMIDPLAANPWSSRVTLQPVAPRTFRMLRGGSPYGELVRFEVDQNGRATRLVFTGESWPRR